MTPEEVRIVNLINKMRRDCPTLRPKLDIVYWQFQIIAIRNEIDRLHQQIEKLKENK